MSNSHSQRMYIQGEAPRADLPICRSITADMNRFDPGRQFDRIVSVEMFEHMMNWRELLARMRHGSQPTAASSCISSPIAPAAYLFDRDDKEDWIAQHFFTGGVMPSHHLIRQYADLFEVEEEWRWSGEHYQRTALDWLSNFDANRAEIETILRKVYGEETALVDAAVALVLPRHRRPLWFFTWQRMGRQPLPDGAGVATVF